MSRLRFAMSGVALIGILCWTSTGAQAFGAPPQLERPPSRLSPASIAPFAADDDFPGVPLGATPFTSSLNPGTGDVLDVMSVSLSAGQVFAAELTMPPGRFFFVAAYPPDALSLDYDYMDISIPWDASHMRIQFYAPDAGTYYVAVWCLDDSMSWGQYTLDWSAHTLVGDDEVTGAASPAGTHVADALNWRNDPSDIFQFDLAEEQELVVTLTAGAGSASPALGAGGFDVTVYPAGITSAWTLGNWPAKNANTAGSGGTVSYKYHCPPGGAGTIYLEIHAEISSASYSLDVSVTDAAVSRFAGANRYATSYEISKASFAYSDVVVLAGGRRFPDALSASGLAGVLDAPLLLVPESIYDAEGWITADGFEFRLELLRLGASHCYIVGGMAAVPIGLAEDLEYWGLSAHSIAGFDRFETSAAVADFIHDIRPFDMTLVASGRNFADALSASPYAYSHGYPILLTDPAVMPASIGAALASYSPTEVVVLGGTAAVSQTVQDSIDAAAGIESTRVAGSDRYDTAVQFARYAVDVRHEASWSTVCLATAWNFPDALSGGAACGVRGGVLLLTPKEFLAPAAESCMTEVADSIDRLFILGGTSAVSSLTETTAEEILHPVP